MIHIIKEFHVEVYIMALIVFRNLINQQNTPRENYLEDYGVVRGMLKVKCATFKRIFCSY